MSLSCFQLTGIYCLLNFSNVVLREVAFRGGLQTIELRVFTAMKSSANSDGRVEASGTASNLFRAREGDSTGLKKHRHWLTRE